MFSAVARRRLAGLILASTVVARPAASAPAPEVSLAFDPARFTARTATLFGKSIAYRAYEGIVYVRRPVDPAYQRLSLYVPAAYYEGRSVGGYDAQSAPIFFPNSVGGYMPSLPSSPGPGRDGGPNALLVALARGFVVAAPGTRGRTSQDAAGRYTGKAPAAIVDLKAAVRYLRLNDSWIPGDAKKIVSSGTSAGGALSALLAASGNDPAYEPYLKAMGAADARDDVYAASVYAPITDLDHADMAYEWQFAGVNDFTRRVFEGPPPGAPPDLGDRLEGPATLPPPAPAQASGTLTAAQVELSRALAAGFPAYLNSLGLTRADGSPLTLGPDGNGSFKELVKAQVIASAQRALAGGADLSSVAWVAVADGKVTDVDLDRYVRSIQRLKPTPAFDGVDLGTGENELFGSETVKARHFTPFGEQHSTVPAPLIDRSVVSLMNPLRSLGGAGVTTARFWRIRHGMTDRDTSLAVPVILATRLANTGREVDFALPWGVGHGGDYDLDELFDWMARVCR